MFRFLVNIAISLICIKFLSNQAFEVAAHSARCPTCKYDSTNYEAESTVVTPMGDADLGETPFGDGDVKDMEKPCCESLNPPETCSCRPNNSPIEAHEVECTKNVELLFSEKPQKVIDFASVQCRACGVIHPPNSNNVILHCYSCNKSDVWQNENGEEIMVTVEFLELPHYTETDIQTEPYDESFMVLNTFKVIEI